VTTTLIEAATCGTYPVPARALLEACDFDKEVAELLADAAKHLQARALPV
jgi:hypothetical protein